MTTEAQLLQRLDQIRADGYAATVGEFADDINGFGAAIKAADGRAYGAINVYGPAFRFPGNQSASEVGDRLVEVAATILAASLSAESRHCRIVTFVTRTGSGECGACKHAW